MAANPNEAEHIDIFHGVQIASFQRIANPTIDSLLARALNGTKINTSASISRLRRIVSTCKERALRVGTRGIDERPSCLWKSRLTLRTRTIALSTRSTQPRHVRYDVSTVDGSYIIGPV